MKNLNRDKLIGVFKETMEICRDGLYKNGHGEIIDIKRDMEDSIDGTEVHGFDFDGNLIEGGEECKIFVTMESTVMAGKRIWDSGERDIVALNFASGISVGGGVLAGAKAQEEDLCRCSSLWECLNSVYAEEYYEMNRREGYRDGVYSDYIIHSANVPFFRDDKLELLEDRFLMSIVTSPAPCLINFDMEEDGFGEYIGKIFEKRARRMLRVMAYHGYREIILGAWGCGAFGNDAREVSKMFKKILREGGMGRLFDRVTFAVYAKDELDLNYSIFRECFKDEIG